MLLLLYKPAYIIVNYNTHDITDKLISVDFCIYMGFADAHHKGLDPFLKVTTDTGGNITGLEECINSLKTLLPPESNVE